MQDEKVQSIESLIQGLHRLAIKGRIKNDIYNKSSMSSPSYANANFTPVLKTLLKTQLSNIADNIHMSNSSKRVGNATIDKLVDYCAQVQKDTKNQLFNLSLGTRAGIVDNTVTAVFKYAINKYGKEFNQFKAIAEACNFNEEDIQDMEDEKMTKFANKVEKMSPDKLNEEIAERVMTATKDFIEKRNEKAETIKDIYRKAASDVQQADNDSMKESIELYAKGKVSTMDMKPISLFEAVVNNVCEYIVSHDSIGKLYFNEDSTSLNMNKVMDDAQAIYTVLEEVNTYELIKLTPEVLTGFLKSFKE